MELIIKGLPENNYDCRFKIVNILMYLFVLVIAAIYWICGEAECMTETLYFFVLLSEILSPVLEWIVLVWGIFRMVRVIRSLSDQEVNKVMTILHILAFLLVILASILAFFTRYPWFLLAVHDAFETMSIVILASCCIC
jgi:hypothetical protein